MLNSKSRLVVYNTRCPLNKFFIALLTVCCLLLSACNSTFVNQQGEASSFDIIAHRGASGFLPEHTKEAAVLAFMQGADYIEQDLVVSKDNELIVLHDIHLALSTNVETVFPQRRRNDGKFYVVDFTLAELRQLSIHERHNAFGRQLFAQRYKGKSHFSISTFAEHVELIRHLNEKFGRNTGWYAEIKSPKWHAEQGKDITLLLAQELKRLDLDKNTSKLFIQSFDPSSLKRLKFELGIEAKLMQLVGDNAWKDTNVDFSKMLSIAGMSAVKQYADGIIFWLPQVFNYANNSPKETIKQAKSLDLLVHLYTHREDVQGLPDKPENMFNALKNEGADGMFTDHIMRYMRN